MINVLYVGMTSGVGGVENFICNVIDKIDKNKFSITVLTHQNINKIYLNRINGKCKIVKVSGIKKGIFIFLKELFDCYSKQFDIVHLNECSAKFFIYCIPVLFKKDIKLIIHSHNGDGKSIFHTLLNPIQNRRANIKCACSEMAARWMFGHDYVNCKYIKNGIDTFKYKYSMQKRRKFRKEIDVDDDVFVIGSVARFETQKNHVKILDVFEEYIKYNNNCKLVLVGDGTLKKHIQYLVMDKHIDDMVIFLNNRDDICDVLSGFDMLLMPSLYEGLPFIAIEAQASGLPILISDSVDSEVKITDLVFQEKLTRSNKIWAEKVHKIYELNINRQNDMYTDKIRQYGYDIDDTVKLIQEMYEESL